MSLRRRVAALESREENVSAWNRRNAVESRLREIEQRLDYLEACVLPEAARKYLMGQLRWVGDASDEQLLAFVRAEVAEYRGYNRVRELEL